MRDWIFCRAAVVCWCLSLAAIALAEECASDPCLRAVTATTSQRNATADCLSFFAIEPTTRTVTKTVTSNSTTPRTEAKTSESSKLIAKKANDEGHDELDEESQYQPPDNLLYGKALQESKEIPTYASECVATEDYSSACSCLGVSTPSIAGERPTMTVTATVTAFIGTGASFFNSTAHFGNSTLGSINPTTRVLLAGKSSKKSTAKSSRKKPGKTQGKTTGKTTRKTTVNTTGSQTAKTTEKATGKTTGGKSSSAVVPAVGPQGSSTIPSANGPTTVYVVNATTTVIASSQRWTNTSLSASTHVNSTGRYWNSTALGTANSTSTSKSLTTSNATHWLNSSSTLFHLTNTTTHPIWLSTTLPTFIPNTTVRWPNSTTLPHLNSTSSVLWPNTTSIPLLNQTSSVRWPNSTLRATNTSTPTTTPTPLPYPTTCGKDSPPFHLQLSFPGSPFNDWFVSLIGNNLLFTRNLTSSSNFSVGKSGHLCVVGYNDTDGIPAVGSVERRVGVGVVYLLRKRTVEGLEGDYGILSCHREGEGVECEVKAGEGAGGRSWVGCGIQLGLGKEGEEESDGRCTRVGVRVV
ncbi:hypothetical protein B0T14DRAFT_147250 [Immersiella caudata]|uniref:Uncharacterized protein n=1 Tax=Immersiella caudata TaxID=314043 RepID=A0AA40C2D4_9PEZI|nr:hypothetical protein B0T14DRAFT_147250 [Immersiella caudata]